MVNHYWHFRLNFKTWLRILALLLLSIIAFTSCGSSFMITTLSPVFPLSRVLLYTTRTSVVVRDPLPPPPPPPKNASDNIEERLWKIISSPQQAGGRREGDEELNPANLRALIMELQNKTEITSSDTVANIQGDLSLKQPMGLDPLLLGNYIVNLTVPAPGREEKNDRPVGGKWNQKNPIISIQRGYQNLLPPLPTVDLMNETNLAQSAANVTPPSSVAQVINMVVLTFLRFWRIYVILRGDAFLLSAEERAKIVQEQQTPGGCLSERTARVDFDPPRIVVTTASATSKLRLTSTPGTTTPNEPEPERPPSNHHRPAPLPPCDFPILNVPLGPRSSVVLDTPYCNARIRTGMGSRGSLFVFARIDPLKDDLWWAESNAWRTFLRGVNVHRRRRRRLNFPIKYTQFLWMGLGSVLALASLFALKGRIVLPKWVPSWSWGVI